MREIRFRRRDFLRASAGLTGAALSGCSSLESLFGADSGRYEREVLIVGAGLAGLTAAQEFKKRRVPYRVIEASSNVGGRIRTLTSFNGDGQFAELGAEFVDARHDMIFDLCSELNLRLDPVEEAPEGPAFWYKDRLLARKEIAREIQPVLSKLIRERLRITGDMASPARAFRLGGSRRAETLDEMSFEDLLKQTGVGSPAALEYLRRAVLVQFGVEADRQSCLHFLMSLDPDVRSAGIYRVRGGTQVLTRTLYDRVCGVLPEFFVRFETSLVSVQSRGEFFECRIRTPQGMRTLQAKYILFAVPPSALRSIDGFRDLPIDAAVKEAAMGWGMGTHSKTVLSFRERFWTMRDEGPVSSASLLGDFKTQSSWDSSRGQPGKSGLLSVTMAGKDGTLAGAEFPQMALRDLSNVWKRTSQFYDNRSVVRNWARVEGLGGSVTVFEPGKFMRWNGVFEDLGPDARIAFAGEHASSAFPGTMQGAVASARKAATLMARKMGR